MLYRLLLRPLLFLLPAETAHRLVLLAMRLLSRSAAGRALLGWLYGGTDPALRVRAFGRELSSPIGLAAGLDKDAEAFAAFSALGFGFVEVGTVTGRAQAGNPRPRLFRLRKDRALINRMGFNNGGAHAVACRLAVHGPRPRAPGDVRERQTPRSRAVPVLGINIGKTKAVPVEAAVADYVHSATLLAPHADYLVVNVSSPNTPGLRDLQSIDALRPLLQAVRGALDAAEPARRVPLLVKIAPDLADADIDAVADLALELGLDGVIAVNTTVARSALRSTSAEVARCGAGGLSGPPLCERALSVLRRLRARLGERVLLVSVGGIETADDVWERLSAGATLVQVYTALIYEGPSLVRGLNRGLAARLRSAGLHELAELRSRAV
jgi:dihydroorotate dehydrogenase